MSTSFLLKASHLLMLIGACLTTLVTQIAYNKIEAEWFGINIYVYGATLGCLIAWGLHALSKKFLDTSNTRFLSKVSSIKYIAPTWLICCVTIGVLLSIFLGVHFTEPKEGVEAYTQTEDHRDQYRHSRSYVFMDTYVYTDNSSYSSSSSNDLDMGYNGGEALIALLVITLIVLIWVLSALVPSFWVVGSIALCILLVKLIWDKWNTL